MATPLRAASAAELIMYSQHGCPWCIRWHKDIGPAYPLSPEGRYAPLREVDIRDTVPGVQLKKPVTLTPTFVLVENGQEIGRVTGYPGKEFFWELLGEIIPPFHRSTSGSSNNTDQKREHDAPSEAIQAP
jgi:thioredoxin-related protein